MFIRAKELESTSFNKMKICDFTSEFESSSSFHSVHVPPGVVHGAAHSEKSDKYYYIVSGTLDFKVGGASQIVSDGDLIFIKRGIELNYKNVSDDDVILTVVNTPKMEIENEVFTIID